MKSLKPDRVNETYVAKLTYPPGLAKEEVVVVRDSEVRRLYIRVYPTNAKSYFVRYPDPTGKGYITTMLGDTEFVPLRQARDKAMELQHLARQAKIDGQTMEEAIEAPVMPTVAEFCERFLEQHARHKRSHDEMARLIKRSILPHWADRALDRLTPDDLLAFKSQKASTPYECNRTLELLTLIYNVAVKWRVLPRNFENPVREIEPFDEKPRDRVLTSDEFGRILAAIDEEPVPQARALFRLLATVPLRRGEAVRARWDELDVERGVLRIADLSKSKKSTSQPVPSDLLELIVALPRMPRNPYIFSDSTGTGHLIHLERIWRRVLKRAKVTDARIHDLRRTIATNFASSGANEYMIQRMLGHSTAIAGRHYVHLANDAEATRKFLEERTKKR